MPVPKPSACGGFCGTMVLCHIKTQLSVQGTMRPTNGSGTRTLSTKHAG